MEHLTTLNNRKLEVGRGPRSNDAERKTTNESDIPVRSGVVHVGRANGTESQIKRWRSAYGPAKRSPSRYQIEEGYKIIETGTVLLPVTGK